MMNAVHTSVPQKDYSDLYVIIEPVIEKDQDQGWRSTGQFKIYKDAFDNEMHLFAENGH